VTLPLAVSVGDPAGVGPLISVRAAAERCVAVPVVVFGDAEQLRAIAQAEGLADKIVSIAPSEAARAVRGKIAMVDTGHVVEAAWRAHQPNALCGAAQLRTLDAAATSVRSGQARALVTGPTSKAAVVSAGHSFTGQTEFLAHFDGLADDAVSMLFLGPTLRVGLVTTHLALAGVPRAITRARAERTILHVAEAARRLFREHKIRIAVIGLNPHAGEGGLFGNEEHDVLEPLVASLRGPLSERGIQLSGPAPAESVFRAAQRGDLEGVVAMYHDQATIAAKLLDWGASVNTTWGLSFVRTSVDHGVAYDAAAAGSASHEGMGAAMDMALRLTDTTGRG
jgi:4-hydroxythreonine-4-phosphate dehydrogenase